MHAGVARSFRASPSANPVGARKKGLFGLSKVRWWRSSCLCAARCAVPATADAALLRLPDPQAGRLRLRRPDAAAAAHPGRLRDHGRRHVRPRHRRAASRPGRPTPTARSTAASPAPTPAPCAPTPPRAAAETRSRTSVVDDEDEATLADGGHRRRRLRRGRDGHAQRRRHRHRARPTRRRRSRTSSPRGNEIHDKPYKYGGGHGKWKDSGYDCSGSVSYALHGAGLLKHVAGLHRLRVLGRRRPRHLGDDLRQRRPRLHGGRRPALRHQRRQATATARAGRTRCARPTATSSATRRACSLAGGTLAACAAPCSAVVAGLARRLRLRRRGARLRACARRRRTSAAVPIAPQGQQAVDRKMTEARRRALQPVIADWADAVRTRRPRRARPASSTCPAIVSQPGQRRRAAGQHAADRRARSTPSLPCGAKLIGTKPDGRYVVGDLRARRRHGAVRREGDSRASASSSATRHPRQFTEWWQVDRPTPRPGRSAPEHVARDGRDFS